MAVISAKTNFAKLSFNFNFNSYEALFLNAPATEPATPTYL